MLTTILNILLCLCGAVAIGLSISAFAKKDYYNGFWNLGTAVFSFVAAAL